MKNYLKETSVLAAGLLALGLCVAWGLSTAAKKERIVSVRGLAEREVDADQVSWTISYDLYGHDVTTLLRLGEKKNEVVKKFFMDNGITAAEINEDVPDVTHMDEYEIKRKGYEYYVTLRFTIISQQVDLVRELRLRTNELLDEGIFMDNNYAEYDFTQLNTIKPEMIEEATKNARVAGDKFAKDSGSELGKIKNATQGQFDISDRDDNTPYIKNVRIVTYVDFYLE